MRNILVFPSLLTVYLQASISVYCSGGRENCFFMCFPMVVSSLNSIFTLFQEAEGLVLSYLTNREQQCNSRLTETADTASC